MNSSHLYTSELDLQGHFPNLLQIPNFKVM